MSAPTPAFDVPAGVDAQNPWPGLAPFTEDMRPYFFGRDEEAEQLFRLVKREMLTVFFGQSGLGKSSLLQAGLFPRARHEDFFPVYIRLNYAESTPPLADQVRTTLQAARGAWNIEAPDFPPDQTLWEYFHRKDVDFWNQRNRLVTPILVFDQFEEIFTLGRVTETNRKRAQLFLAELADLVENRPPAKLKEKLEQGTAESQRFFFDHEFCKVILSLREDYLPDLEMLRPLMRGLGQNRMRICRLNGAQALQAVARPGAALLEEGVAERIVRFVAGNEPGAEGEDTRPMESLEADPALLSVVCRELNSRRLDAKAAKISAGLLEGKRQEILQNFYERSLSDLPRAVRVFVEDRLLTRSGYRDSIALDNALVDSGVSREAIERLTTRRLLRIEDRLGTQRVELAHDVLTAVIRVSRDSRQQREALEALELAREQARAARRRSFAVLATVTIALVLFILATVCAAWFWSMARDQALARRLAAQADAVLRRADKPVEVGVLLAVESLRHSHTMEGHSALRLGLSLLPQAVGPPVLQSNVTAVAIDPSGAFLATASSDSPVQIWDARTGRRVGALANSAGASALALSPDGQVLATAGPADVRLWQHWHSLRPTELAVLQEPGRALAFAPDGKALAIGTAEAGDNIHLYRLQPRVEQIFAVAHAETNASRASEAQAVQVTSLAFSPDGKMLVSGGKAPSRDYVERHRGRPWSLSVKSWALDTRAELTHFNGRGVPIAAGFTEDGANLWSATEIGSRVELAPSVSESSAPTPDTSSETKSVEHSDESFGERIVAVSPGGRFLAALDQKTVRLWSEWNTPHPTERARIQAQPKLVAFPPTGDFVAVATDSAVTLWTGFSRQELARFTLPDNGEGDFLRFSSNSTFLAAALSTGVRVRNLTNLIEVNLPWPSRTLAISSSGQYLAMAGEQGVEIWTDWQTGKSNHVAHLDLTAVAAMAFSPDLSYLAVMERDVVELCHDWKNGNPVKRSTRWPTAQPLALNPNDARVWGPEIVTFSPDGKYLSAAHGGIVRVWANWDTPSPGLVAAENIEANAIAFAADGKHFVTATDELVQVFQLVGRRKVSRIRYDDPVNDVALSPGGGRVATTGTSSATLWDVATSEPLVRVPIIDQNSASVILSPDGRYMAVHNEDIVQVWHLRPQDLIDAAQARLSRNFSHAEWEQYFGRTHYNKTFDKLPVGQDDRKKGQ